MQENSPVGPGSKSPSLGLHCTGGGPHRRSPGPSRGGREAFSRKLVGHFHTCDDRFPCRRREGGPSEPPTAAPSRLRRAGLPEPARISRSPTLSPGMVIGPISSCYRSVNPAWMSASWSSRSRVGCLVCAILPPRQRTATGTRIKGIGSELDGCAKASGAFRPAVENRRLDVHAHAVTLGEAPQVPARSLTDAPLLTDGALGSSSTDTPATFVIAFR